MPSISPVHSHSVEDEEERGDHIPKIVSPRKSRSPRSTFSERLKAARKLIPSYPGRAKLVQSVSASESSGLALTTNDEGIHSKAETENCATIQQDFRTFFREHAIIMEIKHLGQNPVGGVYVMPSLKSLQVWHGIIFVRVGPYRDGIFRFVVVLEDDFPESRPLLKFTTAVFHPQVHPANGALNLDSHFPLWQRDKNSIWQVLKFMKSCFYNVETWGGLNEVAIDIVHSDMEEFKQKAKQCATDALQLFDSEAIQGNSSDDDGNVLRQKNLSEWAFREGKRMMLVGEHPYLDLINSL